MRKRLVTTEAEGGKQVIEGEWLDLEAIAEVEITSEDKLFPIEMALGKEPTTGWRAAAPGEQTIRLVFDQPTTIRRIWLYFVERTAQRSQEFALFAKDLTGESREVVRQQYTFSPTGSTEEIEDYAVELDKVVALELRIDPDRAHDPRQSKEYASLTALRLGR